jgi:hypothetical protein
MQENPRAAGHSPAQDARARQHTPPAEQKIKVGGAEYAAADLESAIAERAERQIQNAALPAGPDGYEAKLPASFQAPDGVRFEFDTNSPELARARQIAHAHGISQDAFSEFLGCFAATQIGGQMQQAKLREANLNQLGAAGPQRIEAIATWLGARAGDKDGLAVANFMRQYPAAPFVRTFERLIRQFSSQGNTPFSPQHRESADAEAGKIPNYENLSFTGRRVMQMQERMRTDPSYARRGGGRLGE